MADKVKKKLNKRQQQKRKLIIVGIEILCLLLLLGALYVWSLWSKIDIDGGFTNSEAGINEDLSQSGGRGQGPYDTDGTFFVIGQG